MGHNRKRANYLRLSRRSAGLHQHGSGRDAKVPRYGQERRRAEQEQLHGTLPGGKHGREGKRKSGGGVSDVVEAGKPGWLLEKTRLGDPPQPPPGCVPLLCLITPSPQAGTFEGLVSDGDSEGQTSVEEETRVRMRMVRTAGHASGHLA